MFKDDTGAFIEFCSFNFVKSPVLDDTAENFVAVGLSDKLEGLEVLEVVVLFV